MSPNLLNVRRKSRECEKKWQQTFSFDFLLWPSTSFLTFWLSFSRLDPVLTHRQRPVLWPVNSMHWTIMQLIRGVQQFYLYPVFGHQQETCWPHEVYNRGHKRYRLALRRCFACYKNNNDMRMVRIAIMTMTRNLQSVVVVVPQLVQQSPIRREAGVNIPQEKSTWNKFIRDRLWKILMN